MIVLASNFIFPFKSSHALETLRSWFQSLRQGGGNNLSLPEASEAMPVVAVTFWCYCCCCPVVNAQTSWRLHSAQDFFLSCSAVVFVSLGEHCQWIRLGTSVTTQATEAGREDSCPNHSKLYILCHSDVTWALRYLLSWKKAFFWSWSSLNLPTCYLEYITVESRGVRSAALLQ